MEYFNFVVRFFLCSVLLHICNKYIVCCSGISDSMNIHFPWIHFQLICLLVKILRIIIFLFNNTFCLYFIHIKYEVKTNGFEWKLNNFEWHICETLRHIDGSLRLKLIRTQIYANVYNTEEHFLTPRGCQVKCERYQVESK